MMMRLLADATYVTATMRISAVISSDQLTTFYKARSMATTDGGNKNAGPDSTIIDRKKMA